MDTKEHAYLGWGERVHILKDTSDYGRFGYAPCGAGGWRMPTDEPVTCKTCLRIAAKEAAEKAQVE